MTTPSALPPSLSAALDTLVDRINVSSGYSPTTTPGGSAPSPSRPASPPIPPIRALLVGTNEGSPLHRSFGTLLPTSSSTTSSPSSSGARRPHDLSEEVLCGVESLWTTLPSSTPPHVMAAAQAADAAAVAASGGDVGSTSAAAGGGGGGGGGGSGTGQPPHPLLRPLGMGDEVRTVTAFYDTCTLVHVHMSPLVVTIVATPAANIGSVRTTALPLLKTLLAPIRRAILTSRRHALAGAVSANAAGGVGGTGGGAAIGPGGGAVPAVGAATAAANESALMQQAFAAGFQAGSSLPDHHVGHVPVPAEYYHGR